jgi:hypothetical protein
MPAFRVVYTTATNDHALVYAVEWVTEEHWNADNARCDFQERFPNSSVLQCQELELCP